MHYREAGFITLREAITRIAARRAPNARVREYLQPPYPGAPSDLADFAVWRWERHPERDPFLLPAVAPWVAAAAALTDARREMHHALAAGSLTVQVRDAAGIFKAVPRNEWHTSIGVDLIQTGVAGGSPVRDDPAFVAEAPFAAWLLGCSLSDLALIEQCALPSAITLPQACGWIMLRRPGAARDLSPNLAEMLLTHWTKDAAGPDFEGALADLLLALRDGTLSATARDCGNDVPVPARRWRTLLLALHGDGIAAFDAVPPNQRGIPALTGVAVPGTRVVALWPPFATGTVAAAPQGRAKQEQEFIGPVPERWWAGGAPGVWPFRAAATIFALGELCRLIDIKSHGKPPDQHVMPQPRDIHAPGLAEAWWKPNDMQTPILLQRLLRGELRAFGIPGRVGATVPEWIAPRAWRDLKSDPNKQERFEGGGNVYWHVRVISADQVASEGAGPAPAAVPNTPERSPVMDTPNARLPKGDRWSAFDTLSWITFGEVRAAAADFEFPRQEWSRDWKRWPPEWLTFAFAEIATGVPWQPDPNEVGPFGPDNQRTWARRIMADTGESAGQLLAVLTADIERYRAIQDRWRQAKATVNVAMRRGQLRVWGIKAFAPSKPDSDGVHELLDPLLFTASRGVNEMGWIDWTPDGLGFIDYEGPSYDRVFFDSASVRALWPAAPNSAVPILPSSAPAPPKRSRGGFTYAQRDAPLVAEMRQLIATGAESGVWRAALAVADRAAGANTSIESRAKRLMDRYSEAFRAERD